MTGLLDRVRFSGGVDGSADDLPEESADQLPELDRDPEPGKRSRKRPKPNAASSSGRKSQPRAGGKFKSRAQMQTALTEELETYAKLFALTISMSDEHCGAVLNETSAAISRDLAALLARSDWVMERFETTSFLADVVKLLHSLLPLGRAVYAHHVAGRREQDSEGGEGERVTVATDYAPFRPTVVTG